MRSNWRRPAAAAGILCLASTATVRASFTPGDLIIAQLGGTASTAETVTLLDYSLATGMPVLAGSDTLPSSGSTALTLSGQGSHDGHLNFSENGSYLLIAGYRADVGSTNPITISSTVDARVIGRIDSSFNNDTSTALTDAYNGTEIDAIASIDGNEFWTGGDAGSTPATPTGLTAGLRYVASLGATTTTDVSQTQTTTGALQPDSLRNVKLINNQIYDLTASQMSFTNRGLYATATPLPTSGATPVIGVMNDVEGGASKGQELAPDSTGKLVPKTDVVFADLSSTVPGYDTAYTTGGKAEYEKWSLIATGSTYTWEQVGVYTLTGSPDITALAMTMTGSTVNLFAATASGIYEYTDSGGYVPTQPTAAAGTYTVAIPTPLIAPAASDEFRGIISVPNTFVTTSQIAAINLSPGQTTQFPAAASSSSRTLFVTTSVSLSGGTLDLTNNDLDLTGSTLGTVTALVAAGFNVPFNNWAGDGITSSTAAADSTHLTALGVIQNNQSGSAIFTVTNPFDGYVPGVADVLVKYTYFGDANLDGKVDGSDYSLIDGGYASDGALTGWYYGDFNYDGVIDGTDYALIDNGFNNQGTAIPSSAAEVATSTALVAAVPEPASVGLILTVVIAYAAHRVRTAVRPV